MYKEKGDLVLTRRDFLKLASVTSLAYGCSQNRLVSVRPASEAVTSYQLKLLSDQDGVIGELSPLEKLLDSEIYESPIGLVNAHLGGDLEIGNFAFVVDPSYLLETVNEEQLIATVNSRKGIANQDLNKIRDVSDKAVWAMGNGRFGAAVIETDRNLTYQRIKTMINLLSDRGVDLFVIGNEPNDPNTPWRNDFNRIYQYCSMATRALKELDKPGEISPPGLAYYGDGGYLGRFLDYSTNRANQNSEKLPFSVVSDHIYCAVDNVVDRIRSIQSEISKRGLKLKYYVTELGFPERLIDDSVVDNTLAECFIAPCLASVMGSRVVDRLFFYTLLDTTNPGLSLIATQNGEVKPKSTYQAWKVLAKTFARIRNCSIQNLQDLIRISGKRADGISISVVCSKLVGQNVTVPTLPREKVFDVFGQPCALQDGQLLLQPRPASDLTGPAKIIISESR